MTVLRKTQNKTFADVFAKKVFFKISQTSGQSTCVKVFVSKVAGLLQPAIFSKKVVLQNFYKHNFSEDLPRTASKGSSYFVFKHKVDLRHRKETKHFHNTHKNAALKINYRSKYENFNGIYQEFLKVATDVDNLHWFDPIEAAVQRCS